MRGQGLRDEAIRDSEWDPPQRGAGPSARPKTYSTQAIDVLGWGRAIELEQNLGYDDRSTTTLEGEEGNAYSEGSDADDDRRREEERSGRMNDIDLHRPPSPGAARRRHATASMFDRPSKEGPMDQIPHPGDELSDKRIIENLRFEFRQLKGSYGQLLDEKA